MKTLTLSLIVASLLTGCAATKKIMKECQKAQGDFWVCEEP